MSSRDDDLDIDNIFNAAYNVFDSPVKNNTKIRPKSATNGRKKVIKVKKNDNNDNRNINIIYNNNGDDDDDDGGGGDDDDISNNENKVIIKKKKKKIDKKSSINQPPSSFQLKQTPWITDTLNSRVTALNNENKIQKENNERLHPANPNENILYEDDSMKKATPNIGKFLSSNGLRVPLQSSSLNEPDFPKWSSLQDTYMQQILSLSNNMAKNPAHRNESSRHQLLTLLAAFRKLSCRIVESYKNAVVSVGRYPSSEAEKSLQDMRERLCHMANCLNWLHCEPFLSWIGTDPRLNPFLLSHRLDGTPATVNIQTIPLDRFGDNDHRLQTIGLGIAQELLLSPTETIIFRDIELILKEVYFSEVDKKEYKPPKDASVHLVTKKKEKTINTENMEDNSKKNVSFIHNKDNDLLYISDDESIEIVENKEYDESDTEESYKSSKMIIWFYYWKKKYGRIVYIREKVKQYTENQRMLSKKKIFNSFVRYSWQCVTFRSMQANYLKKTMLLTFKAWDVYRIWCVKFNNIFNKVQNTKLKIIILALRNYTNETYDVRNYYKKARIRYMKEGFSALRRIMVLDRYSLKVRLKNGTSILFFLKILIFQLTQRWIGMIKFKKYIRVLNKKIELFELKDAFVKWTLFTYPKIKKLTYKEKVAKYKKIMKKSSKVVFKFISNTSTSAGKYIANGAIDVGTAVWSASIKRGHIIKDSIKLRVRKRRIFLKEENILTEDELKQVEIKRKLRLKNSLQYVRTVKYLDNSLLEDAF